jgi:hypothetical protein
VPKIKTDADIKVSQQLTKRRCFFPMVIIYSFLFSRFNLINQE